MTADPVSVYRAARDAYRAAAVREDAAFRRWFIKRQAHEPTNGGAAARLAHETNRLRADLHSAQSALYALDLDPWDIDDADGVERTPV